MNSEECVHRACCPDWAADALVRELHFTPVSWTSQYVHTVICGDYTVVIALCHCPEGYWAAAVSNIPDKAPHIIRPTRPSSGLRRTRRRPISRKDIELLAELEAGSVVARPVLATTS